MGADREGDGGEHHDGLPLGGALPLQLDPTTPVVYYLRDGDRIKIGYSTELYTRMRSLGLTELLAVEPGHRRLENARHHQFAAHRFPPGPDGTEWFAPHPDLLAHVAVMRAAYLAPAGPPRPPRRIVGTDAASLDFPQLIADLSVMDELRRLDLTTVPTDELAAGLRCAARVRAAMPQLRGLLLRLLRDRGRTWDELSDSLGVPASTLCRWGAR